MVFAIHWHESAMDVYPLSSPNTVWFLSHQGTSGIFCELMGTLHAFSCLTSLQHLTHGPLLPSSSCLLSGFLSFISFPFFSLLISLWLFLLLWYKHGCSLSFPAHFPSLDSPKEILSIAGASVTKWMPLTDSQIPISSLDIFGTLVLCIFFFFGENIWSINAQKSTKDL